MMNLLAALILAFILIIITSIYLVEYFSKLIFMFNDGEWRWNKQQHEDAKWMLLNIEAIILLYDSETHWEWMIKWCGWISVFFIIWCICCSTRQTLVHHLLLRRKIGALLWDWDKFVEILMTLSWVIMDEDCRGRFLIDGNFLQFFDENTKPRVAQNDTD
jgi:hypothetical protein